MRQTIIFTEFTEDSNNGKAGAPALVSAVYHQPEANEADYPGTHIQGDEYFVAECVDLPVVTQARTLDELASNLREAISLQLDGENLADFGLDERP